MRRERLDVTNRDGERLAALIELPDGEPAAYALFAHCFTCSKDVAAASRISRALAAEGFGVVRFDFTGLGNSDGDFASTNFSSNVDDLVQVADAMRGAGHAPSLLVGHSLGGAAVLAAANAIDEARAVATIGAPADPAHVTHLFDAGRDAIEREGEAVVSLAGREFRIRRQFLDDVAEQRLEARIRGLRRALLVLHSPVDEIVGVDNASRIFQAAMHPKSFLSLDDADHLLTRRADSEYAARAIAAWASRYVPAPAAAEARPALGEGEVLVREIDRRFAQEVLTDRHRLLADEPQGYGGTDTGPSPYELLLAALGACTSMTVRMYAARKGVALDRVSVKLAHAKIHAADCEECETRDGRIDRIEREIRLEGDLDAETRAKLLDIADRCPVHRTLHSEVSVATQEAAS